MTSTGTPGRIISGEFLGNGAGPALGTFISTSLFTFHKGGGRGGDVKKAGSSKGRRGGWEGSGGGWGVGR